MTKKYHKLTQPYSLVFVYKAHTCITMIYVFVAFCGQEGFPNFFDWEPIRYNAIH